jgi:hypothetical protein
MPVVVHRDVPDVGLVAGQRPDAADVGRALGEHDVAGVEEALGDQLQRLLAADGDDQVVGVRRDALVVHDLDQQLAQLRAALAAAVLQRGRAGVADHRATTSSTASRSSAEVSGIPPAKDTISGRGRDGEQRPDLRGAHPARHPGGVARR